MSGVSKTYGTKCALHPFSASYGKNSVVGVLGHNGAGKTTLLRMLSGVIQPTKGRVEIDPGHKVGWTSQTVVMDWFMNSYDNVLLGAKLAGLNSKQAKKATEEAFENVGLWDERNGQPSDLSGGQQQRLQIARILAYDPHVLFLDEPTTGLDIEAAADVMGKCTLNRRKNKTIFISSHDLGLIEDFCTDILLLHKGECIFSGSNEQFLDSVRNRRIIEFRTENPEGLAEILGHVVKVLNCGQGKVEVVLNEHTPVSSLLMHHKIIPFIQKIHERKLSIQDAYLLLSKDLNNKIEGKICL